MAGSTRASRADASDASHARGNRPAQHFTDCALCQAPLPDGNRYVCAACAADSARRAEAALATLHGGAETAAEVIPPEAAAEEDDPMACPTCGMRLDPSGRCAACVTTVRR